MCLLKKIIQLKGPTKASYFKEVKLASTQGVTVLRLQPFQAWRTYLSQHVSQQVTRRAVSGMLEETASVRVGDRR